MTLIYEELNTLEKEYWDKLMQLFMRADPKYPEKGIIAVIKKARSYSESNRIPLETALQKFYSEAENRTEKRLELLMKCSINKQKEMP